MTSILRKLPLFAAFLPLLFLTGCWNRLELESQAHVVLIGLDKAHKDNLVEVTFQVANPQVGSTEKGTAANEPPSDIITFIASDITTAKELANAVISRKITFAHLQTIIIGESLAKSPYLHRIIASSSGDPEMRREISFIVSKEKASDFIHTNHSKLETRPHKYYTFMQQRWRDTGTVPLVTINRYFQKLHGELFMAILATTERNEKISHDEEKYIAGQIPQKSGDPVQMIGAAVFKEGKMIGTLTGEEVRMAQMLRRQGLRDPITISIPDPLHQNYRVAIRLLQFEQPRLDVNIKKDPPEVRVWVPLKAQVLSIPSLTDYVLNTKKQRQLKQAINETLDNNAMKLVRRTQKEFKSDLFLWHLAVRRKFWSLEQYDRYEWIKRYPDAKVQVKFDIKIEGFGNQFDPPRIGHNLEDG
jgi:spore germination protein KC